MVRNAYLLGLVFATFTGLLTDTATCHADDRLAAFMQRKLEHSQQVLAALATEDYALLAKHSQAISLLCEDEQWAVMKTLEYQERSKEFRRAVNSLTKAAEDHNLEGAALSYVDVTMKCVTCHKYVRQTKNQPAPK